jgi:WD40 repeat protein
MTVLEDASIRLKCTSETPKVLLLVYEPEQCASIEHLALSPDGTQLAVSCNPGGGDRGAPAIIDVATGEAIETFDGLTGHLIEWGPDEQMLLVVGNDGLLQLYDAESGELKAISHEKYNN